VKVTVFDIETDGFDATKIHVFSWGSPGGTLSSTSDYNVMRDVVENAECLVGHNIVGFDLPVLKRLAGAVPKGMIVDTLALSWYLNHKHSRHGLEAYGERYGVPKPKIDDWENLSYEDYRYRCEEDVQINLRLWVDLERKLKRLYRDGYDHLLRYLTFKMECLHEQGEYGWRLDVEKAQELHDRLALEKENKEIELRDVMPPKVLTTTYHPPLKHEKVNKDGSPNHYWGVWRQRLKDAMLPLTTLTPITVVKGTEPGNPNSHVQMKDWLFSLGWQPRTFDYKPGEKWGEEKRIPQTKKDGELCSSVKELIEVEPKLAVYDGLTVISHRLSVVKGFLESHKGGYLKATAHGLTNTFRFKHEKPLVNIPGVDSPYGEEIRGCLIAPDGYQLIGCDMVSLEDTTKRHYMQPLDPEYVAEMSQEGYDPHLDLAKYAGEVTQEQIDQHNNGSTNLKSIRKNYKAANYACVYGVKETTLSRQTGLTKSKAKKLIEAYWQRNWAVKKIADSRKVREINGEKWIYNEVSGFWHSLRADKDRWSTTNQSTGVYCFDTFVAYCRAAGLKIIGQFHDEIIVLSNDAEGDVRILNECCNKLNEKLKLNVQLGIDYKVGQNYAEVH
jgi:DNA polymerase I-like protein with 3'-5' exonuclease and polymerase domains